MFDNIGKKIKGLAKVIFWITFILGTLGCIISGIYMIDEVSVGLGLVTIFFGGGIWFLIAWIGSFFMYGFGQLIDDTQINRETNARILASLNGGASFDKTPSEPQVTFAPVAAPVVSTPAEAPVAPASSAPKASPVIKSSFSTPRPDSFDPKPGSDGWICPTCNALNKESSKFCTYCGQPRA